MIAPLGTDPLAAIGLATSALIIVCSGLFGLLSVVAVAIAQAHGAKDRCALEAHLASGLTLATLAAVSVAGGMVLAFPAFSLLTSSPAVLAALFPYWCAMAAMTVPYALFGVFGGLYNADGLQSIALGALRGQTDNRIPNAITISVYWAVALPLAYAVGFVLGLGPSGVLAGYAIGVLTAALLLQARFWWRTLAV